MEQASERAARATHSERSVLYPVGLCLALLAGFAASSGCSGVKSYVPDACVDDQACSADALVADVLSDREDAEPDASRDSSTDGAPRHDAPEASTLDVTDASSLDATTDDAFDAATDDGPNSDTPGADVARDVIADVSIDIPPDTAIDVVADARDAATIDASADALFDATGEAASDASPDVARDVSADDGATDAMPACDGSLCGSTCVDLRNDPTNCGSCGARCASGAICSAGTCLLLCSSGRIDCGGACVNTAIDLRHCGTCGRACSGSEICSAGRCVVAEAELVQNGGFELPDVVYPPAPSWADHLWETYFNNMSVDYGRCDVIAVDNPEGAAHIRCAINATSGASWEFSLHQAGVTLTNGRMYDLRFVARADRARTIYVTLVAESGGTVWTVEGNLAVNLDTSWNTYAYRVTAANIPPGDAGATAPGKVSFMLQSGTAGVVEIDDVHVRRLPP